MTDNLIELERHDATVESVLARLSRHKGDIKTILVATETHKGDWVVYQDNHEIAETALLISTLKEHLSNLITKKR